MLGKFVLWLAAAVFTAYGVVCFFDPAVAADFAGLAMTNGNAYAEIGAMYGGLQTGVGVFCIICALTASLQRAGLLLLAIGIGSLAFARLYGAWDADWMVGAYTWGALAYETITAVLAVVALRRR